MKCLCSRMAAMAVVPLPMQLSSITPQFTVGTNEVAHQVNGLLRGVQSVGVSVELYHVERITLGLIVYHHWLTHVRNVIACGGRTLLCRIRLSRSHLRMVVHGVALITHEGRCRLAKDKDVLMHLQWSEMAVEKAGGILFLPYPLIFESRGLLATRMAENGICENSTMAPRSLTIRSYSFHRGCKGITLSHALRVVP